MAVVSCARCGDKFNSEFGTQEEADLALDVCDPCFDLIKKMIKEDKENGL